MSLYKTGTVSVNNGQNTVTGNGTSFIDVANVQLGDLFTVNGSKFYEIYQVDTNTQIRIRNIVTGGNFAETTVTNGDYAIVRNFTSQTSAEIAAKVLAVQQKWQNREEEMTDWFYTSDNWATVTSINGDELTVMTPEGINNLLGTAATKDVTTSPTDSTSGRVMKVGDFGLGLGSSKLGLNADDYADLLCVPGGLFRIASSSSSFAINTGLNRGGVILSLPFNADAKGALFLGHTTTVDEEFKFVVPDSQEVRAVYHSGNTNFNEFGGNGADDRIAFGVCRNTVTAFIHLHINSNQAATGFSATGTFKLVDSTGLTTIATGLTNSDFALSNVRPSNRLLSLLVTFPTASVVKDTPVYLETESSDAKIEVTF